MAANTSYGPWLNGLLVDSSVPWFDLLRRATRERYAQYLSDYAISHDLDYVPDVMVEKVVRSEDGFVVKTSRGDFPARFVVNATGYFSNPRIPDYPGARESKIPQLHAAEYQEPDTIRRLLGSNRGRILIVGKRLSAGEAMESLHSAGFEVCLSHRSPIRFGPSILVEACLSPFTFLWEELRARIPGSYLPWNLDVKMRGGVQRSLIDSGHVKCYPDIERFTERTVVFKDGREEEFAAVLYATGYRPALRHLEGLVDLREGMPQLKGMESADVPGLFFLGLIGLRTFRSQFLRGIRQDACELANVLAKRMTRIMTEATTMA
jgi:putative flavoprotein involved in K+ transport